MKIIALADIHNKTNCIHPLATELRDADLVVLSGDLTMFGRRDAALSVVELVRQLNPNVLAVMGNCDYPEVQEYLEEENIFIHATHKMAGGVAFLGLGGSLPCPVPTLNEWSEETIAEHLSAAAEGVPEGAPMVLVSHQPPKDTVIDLARTGDHVGSTAVRAFIEERQPLVCFSGHIHEAVGRDAIGETQLVNAGPFFDGAYSCAVIEDGALDSLEIRQVA